MPNRVLTEEVLQISLDAYVKFNDNVKAAKHLKIARTTQQDRVRNAQLRGLRPTVVREESKIVRLKPQSNKHMVIPDIQAKPGVDDNHMEWAAHYALAKRPQIVIQIGDWADMPSLSSYDKGKRSYEGRRYSDDIKAANRSLDKWERPIEEHNRTHPEDQYIPRKVYTRGNHEDRITRATDLDPMLEGKLTLDDFEVGQRGWEVYPFLEVVRIDDIEYSHYFTSGVRGQPVSSAAVLLRERQGSATMGHVQNTDMAFHKKTQKIALFAGGFYSHDEVYLGPQGNSGRRQIIMKHEVKDGVYDPMFVSLEYLRKRYS